MTNSLFKVIVAGGRQFRNYNLMKEALNELLAKRLPKVEIVSGTAQGADKMGERYAADIGLKVKRFPAEWNRYGRSAGYRRNEVMAGYADCLVAFWDGSSRGTGHMINLAKDKGLIVRVESY